MCVECTAMYKDAVNHSYRASMLARIDHYSLANVSAQSEQFIQTFACAIEHGKEFKMFTQLFGHFLLNKNIITGEQLAVALEEMGNN